MKCQLDKNHDCIALDLYNHYPNDYPVSPCTSCNMKRINELRGKLVGVNAINLPDACDVKANENIKKIKEIDMKVIGNIDSWLTDIYEQPSRFSSELYSDSDQSMYAEQTLEILNIIKELMRQ